MHDPAADVNRQQQLTATPGLTRRPESRARGRGQDLIAGARR